MENQADLYPSSELAFDRALANNAQNPVAAEINIAGMVLATPTNLTAPSSVVLAACLFTPKSSGVLQITFSLAYAISGAGTATFVIQLVPAATAIAGGVVVGGWSVENGGTPVTVAGGSPVALATIPKTASAAASTDITFTVPASGSGQVGFKILVSSAVNLTAMQLAGSVIELK